MGRFKNGDNNPVWSQKVDFGDKLIPFQYFKITHAELTHWIVPCHFPFQGTHWIVCNIFPFKGPVIFVKTIPYFKVLHAELTLPCGGGPVARVLRGFSRVLLLNHVLGN